MIRGIVYKAIYPKKKKSGYMASVCRSHTKDTLQIEENLMTETLNWRGTNLLGKRQMH
jgi:4'-phosphopantetheinyl transferase EntD